MNKQRIGLLVAASLGLFGTFLPWLHGPLIMNGWYALAGTVVGMELVEGWLTFLLFVSVVVIALTGDKVRHLSSSITRISALLAGFAGLIAVWKILSRQGLDLTSRNELGAMRAMLRNLTTVGFGLYVVLASAIATGIVAYALRDASQTSRQPAAKKQGGT